MEYITIEISKPDFDQFILGQMPYKVKDVKVKDEMFVNDEVYKALKKKADKAYKDLEEYQFKKRHNI